VTGLEPGGEQVGELVERLVAALQTQLPPNTLTVEREPSLQDRWSGTPGPLARVEVHADPTTVLVLELGPLGRCDPLMVQEVSGVVLSRRPVRLADWLVALDAVLRRRREDTSDAEVAAHRILVHLGAAAPADDLVVSDGQLAADLGELPGRIQDRVPPDVADTVARICDTLLEALPGTTELPVQSDLLHRIATDYLPTTLRIFLELPPDWTAPGPGGSAVDLLRGQLAVLERGVRQIRKAALDADGEQLLAHGAFLADRFRTATPGPLDLDTTHLPDTVD
jgi:hypothetical protein